MIFYHLVLGCVGNTTINVMTSCLHMFAVGRLSLSVPLQVPPADFLALHLA
jgi:uncharacterized membrane protein